MEREYDHKCTDLIASCNSDCLYFSKVNLQQRVNYSCEIIAFTKQNFQGFYNLRCVRFELVSFVYFVDITHGWEIPFLIKSLHVELYLYTSSL